MENVSDVTINISEASGILGISEATIRNWVKLGKILPLSSNPLSFSKKQILATHQELESTSLLKSRRNKSRVSSNFIPRSYIDSNSPNMPVIIDLIAILQQLDIPTTDVLCYYAKELIAEAGIITPIADELLAKTTLKDPLSKNSSKNHNADANLITIFKEHALNYIPGEDTLGMLYLSLRLIREKKSSGSYYTPYHVVDRIISGISQNHSPISILDPACGTGNFLLRFPDDIPLKVIKGFDIDEKAVSIARINLAMKYRIETQDDLNTILTNICCRDFLMPNEKDCSEYPVADMGTFDIILGNPPWGYSYSKAEAAALSDIYATYNGGKTPESFSLFIEQSLRRLSPGGTLSFLLPETILEADIHTPIREYILKNAEITSLSYLGEIFDKVQCPCVILSIKRNTDHVGNRIEVYFESSNKNTLNQDTHFTASSDRLTCESFHILCNDDEYHTLEKIRTADCFTLKGNARFCLGIVTGSNKTMLKSAAGEGLEPIVKGKNILKYGITQAENYISFTPDHFQQCAPEELYRNKEKLFYRFIAGEPIVALDLGGTLSLNSANILIPEVEGYSSAYIMAVLNSSVISFYYRKSFKNLKVLRSALESLPIPRCSKSQHDEIAKIATALSYSEIAGERKPDDYDTLKANLDRMISGLYGLGNNYF